MSKQGSSFKDVLQNVFATGAILIAFIVAEVLFTQIMGNPVNFEGGNPAGKALEGNYLGIIYKGGQIVPILMTCVWFLSFSLLKGQLHFQEQKVKAGLTHL